MRRYAAFALSVLLLPSMASAACDRTCDAIKLLLNDRAKDFASVKSTPIEGDTDHWRAIASLPSMDCSLARKTRSESFMELSCAVPFEKAFTVARARTMVADLMSAFQEAEPSWVWFKVKGEPADELDLYGGPAEGKYAAHISSTNVTTTMGHVELEIRSIDLASHDSLAPYRP